MAVYVDDKMMPYGRMKMCHVGADTTEELLDMMDKLKIDRQHLQYPGTWKEHFDVSQAKRRQAVKLGAKEVTSKELIRILRDK
jgi:hypothetical protein